jgi:hypothetical protein
MNFQNGNTQLFRTCTHYHLITPRFPAFVVLLITCVPIQLFIALNSYAQSISTPKPAWGVTNNGLQMSISVDNPTITVEKPVDFYIAFKNVSSNEVVLKVGYIVSNVQIPQAIQLSVLDKTGKKKEFHLSDRRAVIAGRMDDFLVPINPGKIYRLKLSSDLFFCRETSEFGLSLIPGRYRITALFIGIGTRSPHLDDLDALLYHHGRVLTNLWEGKLESNELIFQIPTCPPHKSR